MDRIIRTQEIVHRTGLSRVTLWRKERVGEFPKRVRLGSNSVGWRESEIDVWMNDPEGYKDLDRA